MQLTRLDRWLREKFVHEIHIYSLRPPEILPSGVKGQNLPETPGRRFKHRYIARNSKAADTLIEEFKAHNQMFTTRIVDRKAWYVPLVAPKNKSVTWWCAWLVISVIGVYFASNAVRSLWSSPDFQENFKEALEIMKG